MDKYIYDESNSFWYELQSECYLSCLTLLPEKEKLIGIWEQRHLRYIKEYKQLFYATLLTSGGLNSYLADINKQSEELFFRLVKCEDVTEQLKVENQWNEYSNE